MQDGVQLKYGHIHGGKVAVPVACAANVTVAQSGKFVYMTNGVATLNVDGTATIFGFLELQAGTQTSGDIVNCIIDLTAVYRIPVNSGTYVVGMVGDTCDISVSSSVQGAQLDASVENTINVVAGDADNNNYVDVMMAPSKWGSAEGGVDD